MFKQFKKIKFSISNKNNFIYIKNILIKKNLFIKIFIIFIYFFILLFYSFKSNKQIKVALCTIGKRENLYIKEFVEYYINLGVDHLFIYDDNDPNTEKMSNIINQSYTQYVTIYENIKNEIKLQTDAYNTCYKNNNKNYDWLLMIDMDEYLVIKNNNLKNYLTKSIFNKCDFIKFNWVLTTDNNLIHYDNRSLFERFKKPYLKSCFVKSIIRGNIPNLGYSIHSPYKSPERNNTCNSSGKKIIYKVMNFDYLFPIDIKNAFIIHFKYKSTEEYINKYKRGYSNWLGDKLNEVLFIKIEEYLRDNKVTLEKLNYFEKELNLNLSKFKKNCKYKKF